jgi:hypothetical protein
MTNTLASISQSLNRQIEKSVWTKISKKKSVHATSLYLVVTAPAIKKTIANWSMQSYIKDVLLKLEQRNGFNSLYLEIIKSDECNRMTNDYGDGRPDQHWFETIWCKFIEELIAEVSKTFNVSKSSTWSLTKLSSEELYKNLVF